MLTTELIGGIGNQLFQMAVAYALAWDNGGSCAFDLNNPVPYQGNKAITYRDNIFKNVKELKK